MDKSSEYILIRHNSNKPDINPTAIYQWAQKKILDNVFCGKCLGSVPIVVEKAEMERKDLILRGKCKNCGKDVCRVVEL